RDFLEAGAANRHYDGRTCSAAPACGPRRRRSRLTRERPSASAAVAAAESHLLIGGTSMKRWLTMTAAVSCILAASGAAVALDDGIAREGAGERRQKLNERELTPFPAELWSTLKDWNGGAVTAAEAK